MTALTQAACFDALAERLCTPGLDSDGRALRISLYLAAESSQFVRFNHAAVRQATQVLQGDLTLAVTALNDTGGGRLEFTRSLTGDLAADIDALLQDRAQLIGDLALVPDDPYLLLPEAVTSSHRHDRGVLPAVDHLVRTVARVAAGLDLVGHCASGAVVRAFADSRGQRHWHHVETFHFEWCLVASGDKSVKSVYAGTQWDDAAFAQRVADGARQLPLLVRPPRKLAPGAYRAYFTPTAMSGLLGVTAWSGFSAKARRTGTSSLSKLERGEAALHSTVSITEDAARSAVPAFTEEGSLRPPLVSLVERGRATGTLNSTRSAREYGIEANGADAQEYPVALSLAPGRLPAADALAALNTGLYVSDLWYLNYSDRAECRLTGMTRFACFWVEGGRLVEPLEVMRFDDSFLRMFGDGLIGLTDEAELIAEGRVMRERPLGSLWTPGALVEGWQLTL
ncbi:MAG: metallopeptidase TldD-related protein [Pseudomonadota bacterium]|nr:metallopeptidase TldD-related protein [Pseudomonadota bacterium]